jgi:hypothetical protein
LHGASLQLSGVVGTGVKMVPLRRSGLDALQSGLEHSRLTDPHGAGQHDVIESPLFQKQWPLYWSEDERGSFCAYIAEHPDAGEVIPDSGGLRKVRWRRAGSGKSSGVRVIYYKRTADGELILLTLSAKSTTDNLTGQKLKEIRRALES